jgi:hypothetical protein
MGMSVGQEYLQSFTIAVIPARPPNLNLFFTPAHSCVGQSEWILKDSEKVCIYLVFVLMILRI